MLIPNTIYDLAKINITGGEKNSCVSCALEPIKVNSFSTETLKKRSLAVSNNNINSVQIVEGIVITFGSLFLLLR